MTTDGIDALLAEAGKHKPNAVFESNSTAFLHCLLCTQTWPCLVARLAEVVRSLGAENQRRQTALERYAEHRHKCAVWGDKVCSCGLDAALNGPGTHPAPDAR